LGFRVPCLVISPYTRGGLLSSEVLDHTSQLRLIEARFGVPATGISVWRRGVTGDLTALFAGRRRPQPAVPEFPGVTAAAKQALAGDAATIREASHGHGRAYPLRRNVMPRQERLPVRARI
jgi:phospholipase C